MESFLAQMPPPPNSPDQNQMQSPAQFVVKIRPLFSSAEACLLQMENVYSSLNLAASVYLWSQLRDARKATEPLLEQMAHNSL